ncbi:UDP-glycosyltransferase [Salinimicrobium terrae]|uniref:UDP-glycosyltransferase n=1 Tax=Salinimicrobium terrae TaxID=470866 RepID=UPI0004241492|nr:UDP-glycosyltransferase [Salinimicrobium terrae]
MNNKKIFILLPDGVGLRNFAFTSFVQIGEKLGWEVVFWNQTSFDLTEVGYKEIKHSGRARAKTDLLKRAKLEAELNYFSKKFQDKVYQDYKFPASSSGLKAQIKNQIVNFLVHLHTGEKGLQRLRKKLKASERKGNFYRNCKELLEKEKPHFIFCTNQRPVNAIAPLTAARDLGIPTGSFIFSWDNLPKATMVVEADHYFVWSEYMKEELSSHYPHINENTIHISGTPQFEPHYDNRLRQTKEEFCLENTLDPEKGYICFSGDDVTTSPYDPQYLNDLAEAVKSLNRQGFDLGIIFRRCPVDFSDRYAKVLNEYRDIIFPVAPKWEKRGEIWNTVFPTKADLQVQVNTILHSEAVVNLGSSMVFDFAVFEKPCLFINYDLKNQFSSDWSVKKIYNFVHFRSMPTGEEVYWLNTRDEISGKLKQALKNQDKKIEKAVEWFKKINFPPADKASERIWKELGMIYESENTR